MRRTIVPWLIVMAATASVLRALDALPQHLGGERRGLAAYESVETLERERGLRAALPSYFPDTLSWPPSRIRATVHERPASIELTFAPRPGHDERLAIYQVFGADQAPSPRLLRAGGVPLQRATVDLDGRAGTLSRIRFPDGTVVNEVTWPHAGGRLVLRFQGSLDRLLRMARSITR